MDPLSMTASIIAILQLTTTLTNYVNDVRKATKEQAAIAVEARNLYALLTSLRFRVEAAQSDDPWFGQIKTLGADNGPLDQFKSVLRKLGDQITSSRRRNQIKSALTWTFSKGEVDKLLNQIERLKTLVNCALTNDLLTLTQIMHGEIVASKRQLLQIDKRTERVQNHVDEELQHRISQWLGVPDPSTNYRAAFEKRLSQTGLWLLKGQPFQTWKQATSSFMWLHGSPGCGKTVLSAGALHNILQYQESRHNVVVSYFDFDFNDSEKKSSKKAIRSLLLQCARQDPAGMHALEQAYRGHGDGQQQPAEDTIRSLLQDMLASPRENYLILDALDECGDREGILRLLQMICQSKYPSVRILATSRRERDIDEDLSGVADFKVDIQSAVVDQDIRLYVQDRLTTDPKLNKWPAAVREEIKHVLIEKAGGMYVMKDRLDEQGETDSVVRFRWVFCQLESLRQCIKLSALRKALISLPKTLDETYERILQDLEKRDDFDDTIKALQWLSHSKRPLGLLELREVLAIETGEHGGFSADERLPDPADVMILCSSLISCQVVIRNHPEDNADSEMVLSVVDRPKDRGTIQVRLAHFSVQEYLTSDRCHFQSHFQVSLCHAVMSEGCLYYQLYLNTHTPLSQEILDGHPLARYAAKHWWQHAQLGGNDTDCLFTDLTMDLFTDEDSLLPWIQLFGPDGVEEKVDLSIHVDEVAPPLCYAASIGLLKVIERLLDQGAEVNAQGGLYGNSLQAASVKGHETIVQMLLDQGAEVNAQGGKYGNSLQAASVKGHETIVQILLDKGAEVNAQGRAYGNALQAASAKGYETNVQILLDKGAEVNAQDKSWGNSLQAASFNGHETIVQILLDQGAEVNAQGGLYGNSLQAASAKGYETIVQILLDKGAEVNAQGGFNGSALQAASWGGYKKVVQILLDQGAEVNAQGGEYGNSLQAASIRGHEMIVQILLDKGAELNAQGGKCGNSLQAASRTGRETIVQMLLDQGAEVNAQGGKYENALQAASVKGHETIVQMLLDQGAEVNAQGGYYGNALQAASVRGHETIVQILLDKGAEVNAQGGDYGNALQAASWNGRKTIVQMLLDAGADTSVLDEEEEDDGDEEEENEEEEERSGDEAG